MTRRLGAALLAALAITTVLYRGAVSLALEVGWAEERRLGGARDDVLSVVAALALLAAVACAIGARRQTAREGRRRLAGAAMLAAGWTWFGWGVADHYVFDRWELASGALSFVGETAFHGVGVAVAVAGWRLLTTRRSPHHIKLLGVGRSNES